MKNLKAFLAVGLFLVGLGFTSCSSDNKYVEPDIPEKEKPLPPIKEKPLPPVVDPF